MGGEKEFTKLTKKVLAPSAKKTGAQWPQVPALTAQSLEAGEVGEVGSSQSMETMWGEELCQTSVGQIDHWQCVWGGGHLGGARMEVGS